MEIADILTIIGIVVSIIFGFFVTHFYSIRDARTRVLKDYYIEQVKAVKVRVDKFFHTVAFGKSSFKKIVNWYDHLNIDVVGIDKGIRKFLDLQITELITVIDGYYGEITKWDDFNDQFSSSNYRPSTAHVIRLKQMKYEIDVFFNNYINHVNESNIYPIWKTQYRRIKQSCTFYRGKGCRCPFLRSIWERIEKHFFEIIVVLVLIGVSAFLITKIEIKEKDDLITPMNKISNKQDSIYREFLLLKEQYRLYEIKPKALERSTSINTGGKDSVHMKLHHGQHKIVLEELEK